MITTPKILEQIIRKNELKNKNKNQDTKLTWKIQYQNQENKRWALQILLQNFRGIQKVAINAQKTASTIKGFDSSKGTISRNY